MKLFFVGFVTLSAAGSDGYFYRTIGDWQPTDAKLEPWRPPKNPKFNYAKLKSMISKATTPGKRNKKNRQNRFTTMKMRMFTRHHKTNRQ